MQKGDPIRRRHTNPDFVYTVTRDSRAQLPDART